MSAYTPSRRYGSPSAWKGKYQPRSGQSSARQAAPAATAPTSAPKKANKIEGDPALWITLQRVTDEASGWTKTTRAMQTPAGVLINTCSRKRGADALVAEALALIPNTRLEGIKLLPL